MLPALVQFIECELKPTYLSGSTEYQVWHFENDSDTVRRLNTCINVPSEKEVFMTLTNFDPYKAQSIPGGSNDPVFKNYAEVEHNETQSIVHSPRHPSFVQTFNPIEFLQEASPFTRSPVSIATGGGVGTVGTTTFSWKTSDKATPSGQSCYQPGQAYDPVPTTLRGVRNLPTGRVVRVWVADSDWDGVNPDTNGKLHSVKVNAILDAFYPTGTGLNIYEKVRKLTGSSEWGTHSYSTLLPPGYNYIDLVYYDINCDNIIGGTVGFFFSGNNFLNSVVAFSNESLVLFLDSKYFSVKDGTTWEVTDKFPSLSLNTVAHEFQHMVHFYQKSVLKKINSSIWFNEMLSMAVEDAISSHTLGISNSLIYSSTQGLGRFVRSSHCSLIQWNLSHAECDILSDYAQAYSYSALLMRNFGGSSAISSILQNSEVDHQALDLALKEKGSSFRDSLRRLGVSLIINPKKGSSPPGYIFSSLEEANFFSSGVNLNLPAGDPYSFINAPRIYDTLPQTILPGSSITLHWKKKFSGSAQEDLYLPPKTSVSITIGIYPRNQ